MTVYVVTEEFPWDDGGSVIKGIFSTQGLADKCRDDLMARDAARRSVPLPYEVTEWKLDLTEA